MRDAMCNQILTGNYASIISETDGLDVYFDIFEHTAGTPDPFTNTEAFDQANSLNYIIGLKKKSDPNC